MVSIIVPVYNVEKYLVECLESLRQQEHSDIEIIMIDDGSSDQSGNICDQYAKKDSRFKVVHQKNGGPGKARNAGLAKVQGEFFAYVDSDDYVSRHYISYMLEKMQQYDADVVEIGYMACYHLKDWFPEEQEKNRIFEARQSLLQDYFSGKRVLRNVAVGRLYRTSKFFNIRFSEKSIAEDTEYALQILMQCGKLVKCYKNLYVYRSYHESLTRNVFNRKFFDPVDVSLHEMQLADQMQDVELDWPFIIRRFYAMCRDLFAQMAAAHAESRFSNELAHMLEVEKQVRWFAQKHSVDVAENLEADVAYIDTWAKAYRKEHRVSLLVERMKNVVKKMASAFKVAIRYHYPID